MSNGLGNAALQRTYTKVALNSVIDSHKPGTFRGHVVDRIQYLGIAVLGLIQTIGFLVADIFLTLAKYAFVGQWSSLNKVQESVSDKKWGTFYGAIYAAAGFAMPHLPGQFVKDAVEATDKAPTEFVDKLTKDLKKEVEEKVADHKKKIEGSKEPKYITEATLKSDGDEIVKGFASYAAALIAGFKDLSADDKYVRLKEVKAQLQQMFNDSKANMSNVKVELSDYAPYVWTAANTRAKAMVASAVQDIERYAADALKEAKLADAGFDVEKFNTAVTDIKDQFEKAATTRLNTDEFVYESFDAYKAAVGKVAGTKTPAQQAANLKALSLKFGTFLKDAVTALTSDPIRKAAALKVADAPKTAVRTNFLGGVFDIAAKPAAAAAA